MARKQDVARGEAPAPTPAQSPGHTASGAEAAQASGDGVKVVVNPRLDASEYVAPDGTRYGTDAVEVSQADYDALSSERVNGLQPIVKEA